jgi:hypothetical protein
MSREKVDSGGHWTGCVDCYRWRGKLDRKRKKEIDKKVPFKQLKRCGWKEADRRQIVK